MKLARISEEFPLRKQARNFAQEAGVVNLVGTCEADFEKRYVEKRDV